MNATSEPSAGAHHRSRAKRGLILRLHAIWGLGQILRVRGASPPGLKSPRAAGPEQRRAIGRTLLALAADADAEVRAQGVKAIGEEDVADPDAAFAALIKGLRDTSLRVRFFAALGLGKHGRREAVGPLLAAARENADRDPFVRHAIISGLAGSADDATLIKVGRDDAPAIRRALVVALRRRRSGEVARFLSDADPTIAAEAARAINDEPLDAATAALAAAPLRGHPHSATVMRVVNANFRLGTGAAARRLGALIGRGDLPAEARTEALSALRDWERPGVHDRVTNLPRAAVTADRDAVAAAAVVRAAVPRLVAGSPPAVQTLAIDLAGDLDMTAVFPALAALVRTSSTDGAVRAHALGTLSRRHVPSVVSLASRMKADSSAAVRAEALGILVEADPSKAVSLVETAMSGTGTDEKRAALRAIRALPGDDADALLDRLVDRLKEGKVSPDIALDVLEAASRRKSPRLQGKIAAYDKARPDTEVARFAECRMGGDAEAGREIFWSKTEVSCLRCHAVAGQGGEAGPDLGKVGSRASRDYLLESVVAPSKQLASGFETVVVTTKKGEIAAGIARRETTDELELFSAEGNKVVVRKADIAKRERGASAMPDGFGDILTKRELRDLIEYLASLR